MTYKEVYDLQISSFKSNKKLSISNDERFNHFNVKSGKFAENLVKEIIGENYITTGICIQRNTKGNRGKNLKYMPDGYIKDIDIYTEVKNLDLGNGSGTAIEKLLYMFRKIEEYDKPVLIIFCGKHELLIDEVSHEIYSAYHFNAGSKIVNAVINEVREKIVDIVKVSELNNEKLLSYKEKLRASKYNLT